MTPQFKAEYKKARAWQIKTYGPSAAMFQTSDGRWIHEGYDGGGAVIGYHAVAAFLSAKRALHFRNTYAPETVQK